MPTKACAGESQACGCRRRYPLRDGRSGRRAWQGLWASDRGPVAHVKLGSHRRTNIAGLRFCEGARVVRFVETEGAWCLSGAEGRGSVELVFNSHRVSVGDDEQILDMDSGDGRTTL